MSALGGMCHCRSYGEQFDGVYLAIGAQKPKELEIPGAELGGVFHALPFLIQKNLMEPSSPTIEIKGNASRFWAVAIPPWIVCGRPFAVAREKRFVSIGAISKTCQEVAMNISTLWKKARGSCS